MLAALEGWATLCTPMPNILLTRFSANQTIMLAPQSIYAIVVGGLLVLVLARHMLPLLLQLSRSTRCRQWIFQHVQAVIIRRTHLTPPITRSDILLQLSYWIGTACYNVVGTMSVQDVSRRAAAATAFNTIPLLLGDRLDFVAKLFALSRSTYHKLHTTIGLMAAVQMALHVTLQQIGHQFDLKSVQDRYGLLATLSLSAMALLALPRRYLYETFLVTHQALAVVLVFALWRYTGLGPHPKIFLMVGVASYVLTSTYRFGLLVYRNFSFSRGWSRCSIFPCTRDLSVVELQISLARPIRVACGQYVLLWAPGVSVSGIFQRHPFSIAWWHSDEEGKAVTLSLVVQPQHGLTSYFSRLANSTRKLLVTVEGPYGQPINTAVYGTVVLFASNMGIAGIMGVVKDVVTQRRQWSSSVQRIILAWQVDDAGQCEINERFMTELFETDDTHGVLEATVYVTSATETVLTESWGSRAKMQGSAADPSAILAKEAQHPGRALVCGT
ncbi:hypothetical protein LTR24_004490 [Lithohypha guttulata]|uniref:ferric-chelate reductase (NADPH) n=1 Tax=Lithohypha guttulata TaxID=1690604 RepID=A0ABR0KBV6_9EURO|nr:hypothetical protein LTR24_004490 [Lithohypha guttulata]